jgi:hypothetical protein
LRPWAPPGEANPWQCLNTGQAENGFFLVQLAGDTLRAAYRRKHWQEEKLADGKPKRTWNGTWEWQYPLTKSLQASGRLTDPAK